MKYYQLNSFNEKIIYKIVVLIRRAISHYLNETYCEKMSSRDTHENIAEDESLFCHFQGMQ